MFIFKLLVEMENSCPICLEQGNTELITKCDCKYEYHLECLTKWLENGKTCPTCRQDLSEKADTLDTSDRVLLIDSTSSSYSNVITYINDIDYLPIPIR